MRQVREILRLSLMRDSARPGRHARAFADLAANDETTCLSHAECLALLLDHEATYRNDRRLACACGTPNCAIIGPTGIGKSWLACAIGHKACRDKGMACLTHCSRQAKSEIPSSGATFETARSQIMS